MIDSIWEKEKWRYGKLDDFPGDLNMRDVSGDQWVEINRLDVDKAREALSVWASLDDKNTT
jgi:hypothetical protein